MQYGWITLERLARNNFTGNILVYSSLSIRVLPVYVAHQRLVLWTAAMPMALRGLLSSEGDELLAIQSSLQRDLMGTRFLKEDVKGRILRSYFKLKTNFLFPPKESTNVRMTSTDDSRSTVAF